MIILEKGFGILQHLTAVANKGIHFKRFTVHSVRSCSWNSEMIVLYVPKVFLSRNHSLIQIFLSFLFFEISSSNNN